MYLAGSDGAGLVLLPAPGIPIVGGARVARGTGHGAPLSAGLQTMPSIYDGFHIKVSFIKAVSGNWKKKK